MTIEDKIKQIEKDYKTEKRMYEKAKNRENVTALDYKILGEHLGAMRAYEFALEVLKNWK